MIIISNWSIKTFVFIINTIGSVDDLIECNNKFLGAIQHLLSIKYKSYCLLVNEKSELSLLVERTGKLLKNKEWFNSKIIDLSTMPNDNIFIDDFSDGDNFTTNVKTVDDMDLLYGSIRPYFKKAGFNWNSKYIAGSVYSFSPKHESDFLWILATICSDDFHKYTASNSQGTKMPIINWDTFIRYKVPYSKQMSEKYTKELKPLFMKAVLKLKQNEILKAIKKKLLEKYF